MENEIPKPPDKTNINRMINNFPNHVMPYPKRCQACGLEYLNTEQKVEFHRVKVFVKKNPDNKEEKRLNPVLQYLMYDSEVTGRRGEFCHQQQFCCGDLSVWLAVCEPTAPQNVWERFMERLSEEDEKCQTVMVCNKCYQNKNWLYIYLKLLFYL